MQLWSFVWLAIGTVACSGGSLTPINQDASASNDASTVSDGGIDVDAAGPRSRLMYVSTGSGQRLAVVRLEVDGTMVDDKNLAVSLTASTGALVYGRSTQRLYLGVGPKIATLDLDAAGAPSLLGTTDLDGPPTFIGLTENEGHMVTAYFSGNNLRVHDVSGTPEHPRTNAVDTAVEPHAALRAVGDRFYVPHRNGGVIHWYDVAEGVLKKGGELISSPGVGPRHIAFTPGGQFGYVVNEFDDSVTAHTVASDGALSAIQTITTIPSDFPGDGNTCADIHITPDGQFLYASNRGHDSIAMFSIGSDGMLTSLGQIATEARPREFDISPGGRFIVVAGQDSGALQSYSVQDNADAHRWSRSPRSGWGSALGRY